MIYISLVCLTRHPEKEDKAMSASHNWATTASHRVLNTLTQSGEYLEGAKGTRRQQGITSISKSVGKTAHVTNTGLRNVFSGL